MLLVFVPLTKMLGSINSFEPIADARVVVEKTEATKESVVALGKVSNPGKSEMRVSMLEMQFFDADGKFIDRCTDYTYGLSVKAGESENFKAVCALAATSEAGVAGTTIMPSTLKHFSKVEVKAKGAYLGASLFSLY